MTTRPVATTPSAGKNPPLARRLDLLIVASAAIVVAISVGRFGGPTYTLEPSCTDHLRHEYTGWASMRRLYGAALVALSMALSLQFRYVDTVR